MGESLPLERATGSSVNFEILVGRIAVVAVVGADGGGDGESAAASRAALCSLKIRSVTFWKLMI